MPVRVSGAHTRSSLAGTLCVLLAAIGFSAKPILSTVIPAWLMSEGFRLTRASHAAMAGSVGPVATILFGFRILSEPVNLIQITGAALVLAGVTLARISHT